MVVAVLALLASAFALMAPSVLSPLLRPALHLSEVGVGAIATAGYGGAMLSATVGGRLTDRVGPARVIVGGMALLAVGCLVVAASPVAAVLYAGVVVVGLGHGAINPATTVLANPPGPRRRGLVMSLKQSGVPLGGAAAGALLPSLAGRVPWRWALVAPVLVCLAVAVVAVVWSAPPVPRARATSAQRDPGWQVVLPWAYGYGLLAAGVQVTLFTLTTVYLVEDRDLTATRAGLGTSLLFTGGLLGRPVWGLVSDLLARHRPMVLLVNALLAAGLILALPLAAEPLLPLVLIGVGLSAAGWNGVYVAVIAEAAEHRVGAASGSALVLINIGAVLLPVGTGALVAATGSWRTGWTVMAAASLCASLVIAVSCRRAPQGEALVPVHDPLEIP